MSLPVIEGYTKASTNGSSTSLTIPTPAGVSDGDLLLLIVANENSSNGEGFDPIAGWTLQTSYGSGDYDCYIGIYSKVSDGDENEFVNVPFRASDDGCGYQIRISNVDPVEPFQPFDTTNDGVGNVGTSINLGTPSSNQVNTIMFTAISFDGSDGDPFSVSAWDFIKYAESPENTDSGNGSSVGWTTFPLEDIGSAPNATWNVSSSDGIVGVTFGIRGNNGGGTSITVTPDTSILSVYSNSVSVSISSTYKPSSIALSCIANIPTVTAIVPNVVVTPLYSDILIEAQVPKIPNTVALPTAPQIQTVANDPTVTIVIPPNIRDYTAYYKFDNDGSDRTGNYNSSVIGATFDGESINLDGVDDYAYLPAQITLTHNNSISLWLTRCATGTRFIITPYSASYQSIIMINDTSIFYMIDSDGAQYASASHGLGSTWASFHHIAVKKDGSGNNVRIFVDNVEKPVTYSGTLDYTTYVYYIGTGWQNSYSSMIMCGKISDLRIWADRTLTDDEITLLYNGGYQPDTSLNETVTPLSEAVTIYQNNVSVIIPSVKAKPIPAVIDIIPNDPAVNYVRVEAIPLEIEIISNTATAYATKSTTIPVDVSIIDIVVNEPTYIIFDGNYYFDLVYEIYENTIDSDFSIKYEVGDYVIADTFIVKYDFEATEEHHNLEYFYVRYDNEYDYLIAGSDISVLPKTVILHIPMVSSIEDETGNYSTSQVGDVEFIVPDTFSEFGTACFLSNGSISVDSCSISGDFTLMFYASFYNYDIAYTDFVSFEINVYQIRVGDDTDYIIFDSSFLRWEHQGVLYNFEIVRENGETKLYINGVECSVKSSSGDISTVTFYIANINGIYMSDMYLYDRALSYYEIKQVFSNVKITSSIETFNVKYENLEDGVYIVSEQDVFFVNWFVQSDIQMKIDIFNVKYDMEMNYTVYDRRLSNNRNIISGIDAFYPMSEATIDYRSSLQPDFTYQFTPDRDDNTARQVIHFPKIYGTGIKNYEFSLNRFLMYEPNNKKSTRSISFWYMPSGKTDATYGFYPPVYKTSSEYANYKINSAVYDEGYVIHSLLYVLNDVNITVELFRTSVDDEYSSPHHIAMSNDEYEYLSIYINGERIIVRNVKDSQLYNDESNTLKSRFGHDLGDRGVISNIRSYDKPLTYFDVQVLYNDPHIVVGYIVSGHSFEYFDIKYTLDNKEQYLFLKHNKIHDIFNDGSCVNHWSFSTEVYDTVKDGLKFNGYYDSGDYNQRFKRVDDSISGIQSNESYGYYDDGSMNTNAMIMTDRYTITWSCVLKDVTNHWVGAGRSLSYGWAGTSDVSPEWSRIDVQCDGYRYNFFNGDYFCITELSHIRLNEWNSIVVTVERLGISNVYRNELFINGVSSGVSYLNHPLYPITKKKSKISYIEYNGEGESYAIAKYGDPVGGIRVFNRVLKNGEIKYLIDDVRHERYDLNVSYECKKSTINRDFSIVYAMEWNYLQRSTYDIINIFGDGSGKHLFGFNGNYFDEGNGTLIENYGDFFYRDDTYSLDAVYKYSQYGNKDKNCGAVWGFETSDDITESGMTLSFHYKSAGTTFTSMVGLIYIGMGNQTTYTVGISYDTDNERFALSNVFEKDNVEHIDLYVPYQLSDYMEYHHYAYQIIYVSEGMYEAKFFIDGELKGYGDLETPISPLSKFGLGNSSTLHSYNPLGGYIDQVRIFDRVLNDFELGILVDEKVAPTSFSVKYYVEPNTIYRDFDVKYEIDQLHFERFDVVYSFKDGLQIYRFDIIYKIEQEYKSIIIRRV